MFREHSPLVDYLRQLLWFATRNKKTFGLPLVLCIASSIFSIYSLFSDFPEIHGLTIVALWHLLTSTALLAGLIALVLGVYTMVIQWRDWVQQADSMDQEEVRTPADYEYSGPYSRWRNTKIGRSGGWRHDDQLDQWLFGRPPISLKNNRRRWVPVGDKARRLWILWGGKSFTFNEWKVRLVSDLSYDVAKVEVQKTDYASSMATNYLCLSGLIVGDEPAVRFDDIGLITGKIPALSESQCSNHLGGDLLVIGPGILWLTLTSKKSDVGGGMYHCTASGSFDWDSDRKGQEDLLGLIETGLRRELTEEARFSEKAALDGEFRIVRYARATYAGGKPQFLALCRYPNRNPDRPGKKEKFTTKVQEIGFPTDAGLRGLVEALDRFRTGAKDQDPQPFSKPLTICVELLRELADGRGNQDIVDWLTANWNRPRLIHVVPVGRSLLDFVKTHETSAVQHALAIDGTAVGDETRSRLLTGAKTSGFSLFEALHPGILRQTGALRNKPDACAEWASVRALGLLHHDDPADRTVVLLANATTEGLRAAVGVATRFASKPGFYYIDGEEGPSLVPPEPGNVYVCRIPGLKPSKDPPTSTFTHLQRIGRAVTEAAVRAQADGVPGGIVFLLNFDYHQAVDTFVMDVAMETKSTLERQAITGWSVSVAKIHKSRSSGNDARWKLTSLPLGIRDRDGEP